MSLAVETFTGNARQFCQWAESDTHDILTARRLLLALMQGIPDLMVSNAGAKLERDYPRRGNQWGGDHKRFSDFPLQYYRQVFAPCDLDGDDPPVTGDVHDDLADIYGDLWHGLHALESGDGHYAVKYWLESYFQHWGHQINATLELYSNHISAVRSKAKMVSMPSCHIRSEGANTRSRCPAELWYSW